MPKQREKDPRPVAGLFEEKRKKLKPAKDWGEKKAVTSGPGRFR